MDPDEAIKQLLMSTGLTCDDLLKRLQNFKNPSPAASENDKIESSTGSRGSIEEKSDEISSGSQNDASTKCGKESVNENNTNESVGADVEGTAPVNIINGEETKVCICKEKEGDENGVIPSNLSKESVGDDKETDKNVVIDNNIIEIIEEENTSLSNNKDNEENRVTVCKEKEINENGVIPSNMSKESVGNDKETDKNVVIDNNIIEIIEEENTSLSNNKDNEENEVKDTSIIEISDEENVSFNNTEEIDENELPKLKRIVDLEEVGVGEIIEENDSVFDESNRSGKELIEIDDEKVECIEVYPRKQNKSLEIIGNSLRTTKKIPLLLPKLDPIFRSVIRPNSTQFCVPNKSNKPLITNSNNVVKLKKFNKDFKLLPLQINEKISNPIVQDNNIPCTKIFNEANKSIPTLIKISTVENVEHKLNKPEVGLKPELTTDQNSQDKIVNDEKSHSNPSNDKTIHDKIVINEKSHSNPSNDKTVHDTIKKSVETNSDSLNTEQENCTSEQPAIGKLEDLRNNLKLQLDFLRKRKKSSFLPTSTNIVDNFQCSKKLKVEEKIKNSVVVINENSNDNLSTDVQSVVTSPSPEKVEIAKEAPNINKVQLKSNDLNTSSGKDVDVNKSNAHKDDSTVANSEEEIAVFDQIRNIINKQKNKKSSLNNIKNNIQVLDENARIDFSSLSAENSQSSLLDNVEQKESSLSLNKNRVFEQIGNVTNHKENNLVNVESSDSATVTEKSPFVSNSLDEFLTESQLNISYQIPKLEAEIGIKTIEEDPLKPIQPLVHKEKKLSTVKNKVTTFKAKTVAQKRRILEREMRKELKVKKRKLQHNKRSYVLYRNKKIWVKSYYNDQCLLRIDCKEKSDDSTKVTPKKKLSLLSESRGSLNEIKYRPGPLCKKPELQVSGSDKWESDLLKLPEISLEVTPKVGKTFCNDVLHRFSTIIGDELDSNKIEFALSMVTTKNKTSDDETFTFKIPFHNKVDNILVRKPKPIPTILESKPSKDPVADVMEDLIRYVEIKELEPTLIKEDVVEQKTEDTLVTPSISSIDDNVSVFRKPQKKRSKIEMELYRLNCKFVNVEVEEEEEVKCTKEFCKLGCVCKSLQCEYIPTVHCQKVSCMFGCSCPKEKPMVYDKLTLPAGTNILSDATVNRIEDEAKKNLAKVEREFTQTVIHTNNKTIVVGIGSRNKSRRSAKIPTKYTDFIPVNQALLEEEKLSAKVQVNLPLLNLSRIIPYCLIHKVYNCKCIVNGSIEIEETSEDNDVKEEKRVYKPKSHKKYTFETIEENVKASSSKENMKVSLKENKVSPTKGNLDVDLESDGSSETNTSNKRPVRKIKKRTFSEDFVNDLDSLVESTECKRVKPMQKSFSKSIKNKHNKKELLKNDFVNNLTDADITKYKLNNYSDSEAAEADLLKQALVQEKMSESLKETTSRSKRKQVLTSRSIEEPILQDAQAKALKEAAIQRRRKLSAYRQKVDIAPVFEGEIIVDGQHMELLRKMGSKTVSDGYARLLPWLSLMEGFCNNTIKIWCMVDQPSRLLINKNYKKCPKNYVSIRNTTQQTEVITWILQNKLPSHYRPDSLSFILKETKDNFEICGICTKNIQSVSKPTTNVKSTLQVNINENKIYVHKDLNGIEKNLVLYRVSDAVRQRFKIMYDDCSQLVSLILPQTPSFFKWRMIYFNSDFAYLFFRNSAYSIHYKDLSEVADCAEKQECTLCLTNQNLQTGIVHGLFGIYFDGSVKGRLFIGPYFNEALYNEVETIRYVNQDLISTEDFYKMKGRTDYKSGYWVTHAKALKYVNTNTTTTTTPNTNTAAASTAATTTIDLTLENDESDDVDVTSKVTTSPQSNYIMHNGEMVKIVDAPSRKPEDFNRYIITNIPHFGYLGAYRHPNREIDVSWPFENKLLRFSNEKNATSFLHERFSSLLLPVPETYNLTILMAVKIDLNVYKPIDSSVLNGHFFCGDFGYYNIMTLTEKECKEKTGFDKEYILKLFAKRAQIFVRKKITHLADVLKLPKNDSGNYELLEVIKKAEEVIRLETRKEQNYNNLKKCLIFKKREIAVKLHKILMTLPPQQRNIENLKFRAILQKRVPIEVHDSEDDSSKNVHEEVFKTPIPKLKSILKPIVPVGTNKRILIKEVPELASNSKIGKKVKLVKTNRGYMLLSKLNKDSQNQEVKCSSSSSSANSKIVLANSKYTSSGVLKQFVVSSSSSGELGSDSIDKRDNDNKLDESLTALGKSIAPNAKEKPEEDKNKNIVKETSTQDKTESVSTKPLEPLEIITLDDSDDEQEAKSPGFVSLTNISFSSNEPKKIGDIDISLVSGEDSQQTTSDKDGLKCVNQVDIPDNDVVIIS